MKGKRIYPEGGPTEWLEGDYWRTANGVWYAACPGNHLANLGAHTVTEHEDGTITVSPSIKVSNQEVELWHGHLTKGVWTQAS